MQGAHRVLISPVLPGIDSETAQSWPDASVCARVSNATVCLFSALQVHEIGTQLPRGVWIAIPHQARAPRIFTVQVQLPRFSGAVRTYGVQETKFEGVSSRITSPARTIVDCFRFERLVGPESPREALYDARNDGKVTNDELLRVLDVLPSRRLRMLLEAGV